MNVMPDKFVKMQPLHESTVIAAYGYAETTRRLYIQLREGKNLCYENVPRFRITGLLSTPKKDDYYKTQIKPAFLAKEIAEIPGQK
jgi:hypothetical protein